MPHTVPKADNGFAVWAFRDRRFGTIKFSKVFSPLFRLSARARGMLILKSLLRIGIFVALGLFSRIRRVIKRNKVKQFPRLLPRITDVHARIRLWLAQYMSNIAVSMMENSCSVISMTDNAAIRFAAVK